VLAARVWLPSSTTATLRPVSRGRLKPAERPTAGGDNRVVLVAGLRCAVVMAGTVQRLKTTRISLSRLVVSTVDRMQSRFNAWCHQIGCKVGSVALSAGVALGAFGLLSAPAQAIPEADAVKKLQVVPVFVITDSNGVPLPIPREKELILPLYLESAKANEQLAALNKSNPQLKAGVVALPLNVMNQKVVELNKQLKDKNKPLVAPIVGNAGDRTQAVKILKDQGLTEKQIQEGLNVPVFFTKPFLTIKTPEGPRGVFFFSYENLQNALNQLPPGERSKLTPQVADLTAVLREIVNAPSDSFTIFPTPEYFRLVKENEAKKAK